MKLDLSAPQPLLADHVISEFRCGEAVLDEWLQRRALANQASGASRTFVVVDPLGHVYGYYSLAAGAVTRALATGRVRRNMPEPVPVLVLGRLAVDSRAHGAKLGAALLQDAVARAERIAVHAGVRALLVHALHARAKRFYEHYGFTGSPADELLLMLRLEAASAQRQA